jgi:hypothetical protein
MNRAFSGEDMARKGDFIFVRCADVRTAKAVKSTKAPEFIVFDCEAERVGSWDMKAPEDLNKAMKEALEKYADKTIAWEDWSKDAIGKAKEARKLAVLFFADDKKDSQEAAKLLEDRVVAKYHEKCVFIKVAYTPDGADPKTWGVNCAPSVVLVDPNKEGTKGVIERLLGLKYKPLGYKASIVKALDKMAKDNK